MRKINSTKTKKERSRFPFQFDVEIKEHFQEKTKQIRTNASTASQLNSNVMNNDMIQFSKRIISFDLPCLSSVLILFPERFSLHRYVK